MKVMKILIMEKKTDLIFKCIRLWQKNLEGWSWYNFLEKKDEEGKEVIIMNSGSKMSQSSNLGLV